MDKLTIDSPLTLGEIEFVEDTSGLAIETMGDPERPKMKFVIALVTVLKRREDGDWTIKNTRELAFTDLQKLIDLGDDSTLLALGIAEEVEVADEATKSD
ncbi:hypothetical protein [Agrococcus casei]|uniref:Tail assembly chaperone n=1 Tax=Agrococcus casei LMG 22410 TaxID=1255656 RepID=A0A1R4GF33_9MICO|nr:hypothetical protein [Agrococcus casei]SJM66811.1 hypothetical protein CZ674_11490 [Agrococcus casei LMG 22410]